MPEKTAGANAPQCIVFVRKKRSHGADALQTQEDRLLAVAKEHGYDVGEVIRDDEMADSINGRPKLRRLLNLLLEGKYRFVVVEDVSRFCRCDLDTMDIVATTFYRTGATVVFPGSSLSCADSSDADSLSSRMRIGYDEYIDAAQRLLKGKPRHKSKFFEPKTTKKGSA